MKSFPVLLLFFFLHTTLTVNAQPDSLKFQLEQIIQSKKARIGFTFAGLDDDPVIFSINGSESFPMQSVYKFHLAMAALDQVDEGKLRLDQDIYIKKSDLLPDSWSPIRDKYPDGNIFMKLSEIINYTVAQSDNNGCDILFRLLGGTKEVEEFIHQQGIKDISIKATEEEMHQSWEIQFTNHTTPLAAVGLLKLFYEKKILSAKTNDFLWKIMTGTKTGLNRIPGLLPPGTVAAHKTGSSGTNEQGITAACNDIGIVRLPDGRHFAIAVFITDSKENSETNSEIIAQLTRRVWDFYIAKYPSKK
jgi:beta-lactamase class A